MQRFDRNGDGTLDASELREADPAVQLESDADRDGFISAEEILNYVIGSSQALESGTVASDREAAQRDDEDATETAASVQVSFTVVQLPEAFAQSEAVSLEGIVNQIQSDGTATAEDGGESPNGIRILDQYEFEAANGMVSELRLGGKLEDIVSRTLSLGKQGQVVQTREISFGSQLKVRPLILKNGTTLSVDYRATFVAPQESQLKRKPETIEMSVNTTLLFSGKPASVLNVFSGGRHFLILVSAAPGPV